MATQLFQAPHGSPAWFHGTVAIAACGHAERVVLTPALAGELLKQNPKNRAIRDAKYQQLVSDIADGRWVFNGEPLLISEEGLLNDGQHRSEAVVEANVAIETMMIFGLPRSSRVTVDQGAAKTASDYMEMDGVPNAKNAAAIARLVLAYDQAGGITPGDGSRVSSGAIRSKVHADEGMAASATFAASMHRHARRFAAPSIIGTCHYILSRVHKADADAFMRQVSMGENIKQRDPAFAVREALLRERTTRNEKLHLIFRGWNAYRQKRSLSLAKVSGNLPALI